MCCSLQQCPHFCMPIKHKREGDLKLCIFCDFSLISPMWQGREEEEKIVHDKMFGLGGGQSFDHSCCDMSRKILWTMHIYIVEYHTCKCMHACMQSTCSTRLLHDCNLSLHCCKPLPLHLQPCMHSCHGKTHLWIFVKNPAAQNHQGSSVFQCLLHLVVTLSLVSSCLWKKSFFFFLICSRRSSAHCCSAACLLLHKLIIAEAAFRFQA